REVADALAARSDTLIGARPPDAAAALMQAPPAQPLDSVSEFDTHAEVKRLLDIAVTMPTRTARFDDAMARVVLHPVFGLVILAVLLFFMFPAVFSWAAPMMDGIEAGVHW
ncbi:hypothetical protein KC219_21180, partial [Mycobacterium tuberculosis]|nr:hypothetical protein [Mycobacterium tuberculosis]